VKDIIKLVVVLGCICVASGLTLGAVNQVTKKPIELQILNNIQGPALASVLGAFDQLENNPIEDSFKLPSGTDKRGKEIFRTVFPAKKNGRLYAVALEGTGKGFDGSIGVMVGINPQDDTLTGVGITEQSETPGIGSKIKEPVFTEQFRGKTLNDPTSVDGISGATYSTRGTFEAVNNAVEFFKQHKDEILAQARG
jgi:Na+-translocating ferredoxin:NAD+ oxidoreductase subunit G